MNRKCCGTVAMLAGLLVGGASSAKAQFANNDPMVVFAPDIPMLNCDGVPCVEVRTGDGKVWKMGLDTGNANSVLAASAAEAAGLKPTKPSPAGWPAGMFITSAPILKIGEVTLNDVPLLAMNFAGDVANGTMPHVDGTLAYTVFNDRALQFDFAAHAVRISEPRAETMDYGKFSDTFSLVTFGKKGPPIVVAQGFQINGKNVTAQIDTMFTGSLLIYGASIEKLGLAAEAKATDMRKFPLTDGGVTMKVAPAKRESFHGLTLGGARPKVYFPTEGVHEPDGMFDATVGLELFQGMLVTLDFHDRKVCLQKGGTADD